MTPSLALIENRRLFAAFAMTIDWTIDTLMWIDSRADSDALLAALDDADLVELLCQFADQGARDGLELVLRADGGEPLRLNLTSREWRHGVVIGRGVVSAMASFTGQPDAIVSDQLFALLGRALLKAYRDVRRELRDLEACA